LEPSPKGRTLGYYTRIDLVGVRVKPEHIRHVEQAIRGRIRGTKEFQYMIDRLSIDSEGVLVWAGESVGKWYRDEEFVAWLAPHCLGGFVALWGHEGNGDAWAYEFDGKAGFSCCSARRAAAKKGILARRAREAGAKALRPGSGSGGA
jgi:hypothetical protein